MNTSTRTFFIAGVKFRPNWMETRNNFRASDDEEFRLPVAVALVGEPANQYDRYAIKVIHAGDHISYVPKPINVDIWALRDAGYKPHARIIEFNNDAMTHEMYKVQVDFDAP